MRLDLLLADTEKLQVLISSKAVKSTRRVVVAVQEKHFIRICELDCKTKKCQDWMDIVTWNVMENFSLISTDAR